MSSNNVMSDIIKQLHYEEIVLKNFNAMRFFMDRDAVNAIVLANAKKFNDIFNIASSEIISIYELAKTFLKLSDIIKKIIGLKNSSKIERPIKTLTSF